MLKNVKAEMTRIQMTVFQSKRRRGVFTSADETSRRDDEMNDKKNENIFIA